MVEIAISALHHAQRSLFPRHDKPPYQLANAVTQLEQIRDNDSLRNRYRVIVNQGVVLLVSYFESSMRDLYIGAVHGVLERGVESALLKQKITFSLQELQLTGFDLRQTIGERVVQEINPSFQDMKSIARAFQLLTIEIDRGDDTNDIITAQACRHAIVHSGAIATPRTMGQVAGAWPRQIRKDLSIDAPIEFAPSEVDLVAASMTTYITRVQAQVSSLLPSA